IVVLLHETRRDQVIDDVRQIEHFKNIRSAGSDWNCVGYGAGKLLVIGISLPFARLFLEPARAELTGFYSAGGIVKRPIFIVAKAIQQFFGVEVVVVGELIESA